MSHRRLALLAVAASLVLVVGLYARTRLERISRPPSPAPPSEASALQQLSHEGMLRRASSFVSKRASEAARYMVWVPQSAASGVRWRGDTVLSAGLHRPIDVSISVSADSGTATLRPIDDSLGNDWLLLVGRARSGAVLSLAGAAGGSVRARCDSRDVDELLLNVPLEGHLAGAGVFDIDGALVGMVVRCGRRLAAVPVRQIAAMLAQRDSSPSGRADALGAALESLDSLARIYFGSDTGVLVVAVKQGSIAQTVGLRPGDVLFSIDGAPMISAAEASRTLAFPSDTTHRIMRLRGRGRSVLRVRIADAARDTPAERVARALGVELKTESRTRGVAVARVQPGSVAHVAGLRTGDRLTRIGSSEVASYADAERLLRTAPPGPVFIAYERDSIEYGALVRR